MLPGVSKWFLFPFSRGTLPAPYLLWEPGWALGGKSHKTVGVSLWLGFLEFLTLKLVHTEPSASGSGITSQVFQLSLVPITSHKSLLWEASAAALSLHLFLQSWASGLPYDHASLMDSREPRTVVDFSVCSGFYSLGPSGDFPGSYLWDWKLGVSPYCLQTCFPCFHLKSLFLPLSPLISLPLAVLLAHYLIFRRHFVNKGSLDTS